MAIIWVLDKENRKEEKIGGKDRGNLTESISVIIRIRSVKEGRDMKWEYMAERVPRAVLRMMWMGS